MKRLLKNNGKYRKKHIFFIDDEPIIREVIRETLEGLGFNVSSFGSPTECLAQLRSQECDLLITDLKMPEKDGIDLLNDIKHLAPWVPVLIITGYGDIPTAVKAMKSGAVDFIEKPLDKANFVQKIRSVFQRNVTIDSESGDPLTLSEKNILQLVIDGKSNTEIADLLHRSVRTIETHRTHLMRKLGVNNLVDLVRRVTSMGLVDLEIKSQQCEDKPDSESDDLIPPSG